MIEIRDAMPIADAHNVPKELLKGPEDLQKFSEIRNLYRSAIKEVCTKLEILDDEFRIKNDYNPIHNMEARVKSPDSICEKLERRGMPLNLDAIYGLTDVAGIRVICNYIDDIYKIADLLLRQTDIELIARKDYIAEPKPSGYRSLHLVVLVPVFQAERTEKMPVEIQIRTISMDCWASLEHELKYKQKGDVGVADRAELVACAYAMAAIDKRMQRMHKRSLGVALSDSDA